MILLLFLASLGVLHYVLGKAEEAATASGQTDDGIGVRDAETAGGTPGVWALGKALEERGRGPGAGPETGTADRTTTRVPSGV